MPTEVEGLTKRVENLEQQNRRIKLTALVVALCGVVVALVGADQPQRTIEAQKIVLVDGHGRARLTISTPAVTGATIDVKPDDPVIWLTDDKGADRAMLTIDGLFFANAKTRPTVSLSSNSTGASGSKIYGSDNKVVWSAP